MKKYLLPLVYALVALTFACSMVKVVALNLPTHLAEKHFYYSAPPANDNKKDKKSSKRKNHFTISSISSRPYLGIGMVLDSATNLSRSFALFELMQKNLIIVEKDTLFPVMIDYQFTAPYAVTGVFGETSVKLKLYKNGKKFKEVTAGKDWKDIYGKIAVEFTAGNKYKLASKIKLVDEGVQENLSLKRINECLPGRIQLLVPHSECVDTMRNYANVKFFKSREAYNDVKTLYGRFAFNNENKLFFFKNVNVPGNLKGSVRSLVFPQHKSLIPAMTYISCGSLLAEQQDAGASLNSYLSALVASNTVLASPFERALVRKIAFGKISATHKLLSDKRQHTSSLFLLGAAMNDAYLRSGEAMSQRNKYYESIDEVSQLCIQAESKAREIRSQKTYGGIMALISAAGAVATASTTDNSVSDAYMSQAETYLTVSFDQADQVSLALNQQYQGVESKIDASSFVTSDGSTLELGRPLLAGEVYYYLASSPELVKDVLLSYAADKPRLSLLLYNFYYQKDKTILDEIFMQMSEIEARVLNNEIRNIGLSDKLLSSF